MLAKFALSLLPNPQPGQESGPTWPKASTTSFHPFLPSSPPFLQPLSSIHEALRPLPFLHHRILRASPKLGDLSLSQQKWQHFLSYPIWAASVSCRYLRQMDSVRETQGLRIQHEEGTEYLFILLKERKCSFCFCCAMFFG